MSCILVSSDIYTDLVLGDSSSRSGTSNDRVRLSVLSNLIGGWGACRSDYLNAASDTLGALFDPRLIAQASGSASKPNFYA